MLKARKNAGIKAFLKMDKLIIEKDEKRNIYRFDFEKNKLITVKASFVYEINKTESVDDVDEE